MQFVNLTEKYVKVNVKGTNGYNLTVPPDGTVAEIKNGKLTWIPNPWEGTFWIVNKNLKPFIQKRPDILFV